MEFSKNMLFFCYDFGLKNKLKENGIKFITTAISNDQKKILVIFSHK